MQLVVPRIERHKRKTYYVNYANVQVRNTNPMKGGQNSHFTSTNLRNYYGLCDSSNFDIIYYFVARLTAITVVFRKLKQVRRPNVICLPLYMHPRVRLYKHNIIRTR